MAASPSAHAAFESSGPGGKLHWSERKDGHWHADAPSGHFDVVPMARGYHLWFRGQRGTSYVDLGHHGSLGGAFAAARYYLDEPAAAESGSSKAAEESPDPAFSRYTQLVVDSVVQNEGVTYEEARKRVAQHQEAVHAHYESRTPPKDVVFNVRGLRRPAEESAKECCGDEKCAHRHPPSVPTTACEPLVWLRARGNKTAYATIDGKLQIKKQDPPWAWVVIHNGNALDSFKTLRDAKAAAQKIHDSSRSRASEDAKEASLAEAPPPMHVQIPPDAYAQWVAYGDAVGPVDTTEKVYRLLSPETHKYDQEIFLVVVTDLHFKLRSVTEVGRGERSMVGVGIEEVMRAALNTPGGANFLVSHGHPTGKCRPSEADKKLHRDIESASKTYASLKYLDHVVIGVGEFYSIREGKMHKVKG